jgi:FixJ family two-component response regulator
MPPRARWSYFLIARQPVFARGTVIRSWLGSVSERMAEEPVKKNCEADPLVFVVEDDSSLRQAIKSLLQSVGLQVEAFGSAAELLKNRRLADHRAASCLILDVRLPGVSGLDFQAELSNAEIHIPIIFITGHGDIPMTVRAIRAGADEFLTTGSN